MDEKTFDLIVIGAGPGGYVAAIRAAQLGMKVACVEKEDALGGTCLRIGCIPSKALLEASEHFHEASKGALGRFGVKLGAVELDLPAMLQHKDNVVKANTKGIDGLFKKGKIARFLGHGKLAGAGKVTVESGAGKTAETLTAKNIIIATGSKVAMLPDVKADGKAIGTSTEAIAYTEVPKHLVVIGAGAIGLELGSVWSRLGAKVTVLEYLNRILPGMDVEISTEAQKILAKQGLDFKLGTRVKSAKSVGDGAVVECEGLDPIKCDKVLVSVGRVPNTENLGLESVGIKTDGRGRISVDEKYATGVPGIYAIGDVIPGVMLAHKAEEEGIACVEGLAGKHGHVNYNAIPNVVYTHPEIASVGRTEEELKSDGIAYKKGSFPFMANGRARALSQIDGRVKILADEKTDRILGVHIIGPRAGDLIAEAVVAMEFGASSEDIARSSHAHPTLAEVMKEAAMAVDGRAIHI
jgi:dihydrolipoamide dehydrogenase